MGGSPRKSTRELRVALYDAIERDDEKEVKKLIDKVGDVNFMLSSYVTPLHRASFWGNEEIVRLLLNAGASPNAQDDAGRTPLIHACFRRHPKVVKMFLEADADVELVDNYGVTALKATLLSHRKGYAPEIVTMLIEAGAKVKSDDVKFASDITDETHRIVKNAYLRQQLTPLLTPLLSASARGQIFDPRLYDSSLWRTIGKYV